MWNLLKCVLAAYCQVGLADSLDLINVIPIASHGGGFRIKDGLDVLFSVVGFPR